MSGDVVVQIGQQALMVVLLVAAPMLGLGLLVGLAVSVFQTTTSIQEQTLTFVPKVLSIFAMMLLMGHWMLNNMVGLMTRLWSDFSLYVK